MTKFQNCCLIFQHIFWNVCTCVYMSMCVCECKCVCVCVCVCVLKYQHHSFCPLGPSWPLLIRVSLPIYCDGWDCLLCWGHKQLSKKILWLSTRHCFLPKLCGCNRLSTALSLFISCLLVKQPKSLAEVKDSL
jgi:hypothetical protein